MAVLNLKDKSSELLELRMGGRSWGLATGLAPLDEIYSIKLGYPLFIAGSPHAGKTELTMEVMLNCIMLHPEFYCFCYFGEGGEVEDVYADLCHKLVGKPYKAGDCFAMSESEKAYAEQIIDKYVYLVDDEKDMTLDDFYKEAARVEKEKGIKFKCTVFDPFNDVVDGSKDFGGRDDKWLAYELKQVRRQSKKNNRVDILVTHISDIAPQTVKGTNNRYIPVALASEWSGGRTWWRRAFVMLMVYRPPEWLEDENGKPYGKDITLVYVQKAKPKGVAKLGKCKLEWDWQKNKYYWMDNGQAQFAYDINQPKNEPKKLSPAVKEFDPEQFTTAKKEENEMPF